MVNDEQERWRRGVAQVERLMAARAQGEGWAERVKRASQRILEEDLLDPESLRRLEHLGKNLNEFGYDPFGFNPEYLKYSLPLATWVYRKYLRVQTYGMENIPQGPTLFIANHSGQIPIDAMMIVTSCLLDLDPPRMVRSMIERWVPTLPFVSWFFIRSGQILGTRDNFRKLAERGDSILVFPEGVLGINKTWSHAYQLQRFGYGFMRLALENQMPIVPIAVIGAEEQAPSFFNARGVGRLLGMPAFPITPTFPWLGPLGLLPLPVQYHLHYGAPLRFEGNPDDEDRNIAAHVDEVKRVLQRMLEEGRRARPSVFGFHVPGFGGEDHE